METYMGSGSLTWKFYSTSDGRSVTYDTSGPINVVSAPEPMFEENPELDKNEMKQNGAVYFQDTVNTHYEPWQAICQYGPDSKNPEKLAEEKSLCRGPSG
jgi:hypothetical protein